MFSFLFGSAPTTDTAIAASETLPPATQKSSDDKTLTSSNIVSESKEREPVLQISAAGLRRRDSDRDEEELVDTLLTQFPPYGTQKSLGVAQNTTVMAADLVIFSPLAWLGFERDDLEEEDTQVHRTKEGDEEKVEGEDEFYSSGPKYVQEQRNKTASIQRDARITISPDWAEDEVALWYNSSAYHFSQQSTTIKEIDKARPEFERFGATKPRRELDHTWDSKGHGSNSILWNDQVRSVTRQWIDEPVDSIPTGMPSTRTAKETGLHMQAQNRYEINVRASSRLDEDDVSSVDSDRNDSSSSLVTKTRILKHFPAATVSGQLRSTCYACEAPFTTLRRRHCCISCGNIFCSRCCSFYINPSPVATTVEVESTHPEDERFLIGSTVHTGCKLCHDQVLASRLLVGVVSMDKEGDKSSDSHILERIPPVLNDFDNSDTADLTHGIDLSPPGVLTSDLKEMNHESGASCPTPENVATTAPDSNAHGAHGEGENKAPRRFGKLAELGARSWQVGSVGFDDDETKLIGTGVSVNVGADTLNSNDPADDAFAHDNKMNYSQRALEDADMQLHRASAEHLERIGRELLITNAPLLIDNQEGAVDLWCDKIIKLATRACSTVKPNVRGGDLLDIRPYCKVKVIPGGNIDDCAYISGVLFRKQPPNKNMTREILNPKILIISGGIEYNKNDSRLTTFGALLEQEERHLEVLINKITKIFSPDIVMIGRSVSRKAQDLFLKANILLLQSVKSALLERISRQTGAMILSSAEIINQGTNALGHCKRFRLVTFKCDEPSLDSIIPEDETKRSMIVRSGDEHLAVKFEDLPHQAQPKVACAKLLGRNAHDCFDATRRGLAKRHITTTYALIEGCPENLGNTVVFRGASREALKQLKGVFKYLVNFAYSLKLEVSYLRDRQCRLPPDYSDYMSPAFLCSSSLCVDYGSPPVGRKIKPWNGGPGETSQRSSSSRITVADHQSILISTVWMTGKTQCCPAEVKGISYYSLQDVSLGQFLRDSCFNTSLKCQNPNCKKTLLEHSLSFVHNDGMIKIVVVDINLPAFRGPNSADNHEDRDSAEQLITTWSYCNNCKTIVTPVVSISDETYAISFGKVLEIFFYNRTAILDAPSHRCSCLMQSSCTLFFGCGDLAAKITYEPIFPYGVFVCRHLPFDSQLHVAESMRSLHLISSNCDTIFSSFQALIEQVSGDTRKLFGSAANRPEHLQTVLSELNAIAVDVTRAKKFVLDKISAFTEKYAMAVWQSNTNNREALLQFPWQCRKYIFIIATAWNERLSSIGQALNVMKRLAASSQPLSKGDPHNVALAVGGDVTKEEVLDAMSKLHQVKESYASLKVTEVMALDYNINMGKRASFKNRSSSISSAFSDSATETDQPSSHARYKSQNSDDFEFHDLDDDEIALEENKSKPNFTEEIDADVLASRRRYSQTREGKNAMPKPSSNSSGRRLSLGGDDSVSASVSARQDQSNPTSAVKTALNLLFYRRNKELDPYVVHLGMFRQGRPKLEPCINGWVIPVHDEKPSSIIAYSLASSDYHSQFLNYDKFDGSEMRDSKRSSADMRQQGSLDEYFSRSGSSPKRRRDKLTRSNSHSSNDFVDEKKDLERRMLLRTKTHIKHTFRDHDEKGQPIAKFVCTTYWAVQFHALRQIFLKEPVPSNMENSGHTQLLDPLNDIEKSYIYSLISSYSWQASGGKSGASFARTSDDRFILKSISRTELQMFLDCANAYFEYLSKSFFHGLPTVLCKIVGVYQIGYHNRVTGKKTMEQIAVMQNIFYGRNVSKVFDLKGSIRGRQAKMIQTNKDKEQVDRNEMLKPPSNESRTEMNIPTANSGCINASSQTLLDGDFLEFTGGAPMPLNDRANAVFHMSILNDTLFLTLINVLDYSILVGVDEERKELVVGIIDFMRQYDILKQMERVGKSIPSVVAGVEAPTIIQPPLYKDRFIRAMEKYFMTVPNKWTSI